MYTDILPENLTDVNLPPAPQEKPAVKLTRFDDRFLHFLGGDYQMRLRQKQINRDGSFFGSNKRYVDALRTSRSTIIRSKQRLERAGEIRYRINQGRGNATDYWILNLTEKRPVEKAVRPDNITYVEAQQMADCARQFGKKYTIRIFTERGFNRADIKRVLGMG